MQKTTLVIIFSFFNLLFSNAASKTKPITANLDFEITVSLTGEAMIEYLNYSVYTTAEWEFEYGPEGFLPGQGTSVKVSGWDFYRFTLNPLKKYVFRIRENHFNGSTITWTDWSQTQTVFATNDNYYSLGYAINFNNTNEKDLEWKGLLYSNPKNEAYIALTENYNHGDNPGSSIIMTNLDKSANGHIAFVSPKFKDLATERKIRFWVYNYDSNEELLVGTMTDPNDPSTFHLLSEVERPATANWEQRTIYFNNYKGNDNYIVFKFKNKSYNYIGDAEVYIDDISYEEASNCYDQSNFAVTNVQENSAQISFDSPNQTNFQVSLKNLFTQTTETFNIQSSPFVINNLTGNSDYEVKLRANCVDDLYSNWTRTISFKTVCNDFSGTYTTSFEGGDYIDPCWSTNTNYAIITKDKNVDWSLKPLPKTGSQMIIMNSYGDSGQKSFLITPYIANLEATKRIRFSLLAYSSSQTYNNNSLTIGTMSDPKDATTFIPLKTISASEMNEIDNPNKLDIWKEHTIYLDNYLKSNNHHYIALKQNESSKSIFCIDDFVYENSPLCIEPINPRVLSSGIDFATVTWDNYKPAAEWQIEFGPKGFAHGTGTIVNATSFPFKITESVLDDTVYDFYVRSKCDNDYSGWSDRGYFRTKCSGITVGYSDDFENVSFEKTGCWTRIVPNIEQRYWDKNQFITMTAQPAKSGSHSVYMLNQLDAPYPSGVGEKTDRVVLVSPRLKDFDNYKRFSFWMLSPKEDSNTAVEFVIGTLSDPEDYTTFTSYRTIAIPAGNIGKWVKYEIDFSNYYGTDKYVGIKQGKNNARLIRLYIDDFEYTQNDCPRPAQLGASQSGTDSVSLDWKDNNSQKQSESWEIEYGPKGFTEGTGTLITVKTNPFNLTGLVENSYDYRVRTYCEANIASDWSDRYTFRIACSKTAPFVENFDSYKNNYGDVIDFCWTYNNHQFSRIDEFSLTNINSAPNVYLLQDESGTAYLITPYLSDFDNSKKIKFWIYNRLSPYTKSGNLIIGTIKNPLDLSTFEPYQSISFDEIKKTPQYGKQYNIDFSEYKGSNKQIAFKIESEPNEYRSTNTILIDDFYYDQTLACYEPIDIVFSNINNNSVHINWTSGNQSPQNVEIEYGIRGFAAGNGTKVNTNQNEITISDLSESTNYDFYFKTTCGSGNSILVGPKKIDTTCEIQTLPWSENFSNLSAYGQNMLPSCFKHSNGEYSLEKDQVKNYSSYFNYNEFLTGFDDNTFIHMNGSYPSFFSPMFHLVAGTTYKFSMKAVKAYEYAAIGISLAIGRGQNEYNIESRPSRDGYLTEYGYRDLVFYYTPLVTGDYSYQIMATYSGSANALIDNLKLEEGYTSTINGKTANIKYDFETPLDETLILESTNQSSIIVSLDPSNDANNLIAMNGSNNSGNWKSTASQLNKKTSKLSSDASNVWEANPEFITKLNMKVDARNAQTLFMQFDLKQTYNQNSNESIFRVLINGKIIGNEVQPISNDADEFATLKYDLTPYAGTEIRISLQHIGKSEYGDNAYLDNLVFSPTATLSIAENELENLKYYPNPVENTLNIESNSVISKVEVYSTNGQSIFESKFSKPNVSIDFKKYTTGVYLINVTNEDKKKTFKVIKK
ncbi:T9SS-dependent choice-of-anchor J family protein [Flavobacterium aquicola]|uniref:Putative secreted protein (Por secretion system target) n=1 Tax=Flavobacterium aquicola TaxID=1682742 RepID=A0A3E0E491_9FLAO|nr:choice-of-anchor J domain-containing protein [Flavobacterium aquicola]REG93031.1 putative secreted protein (Por secretion system target) [Flavobacterium aquicola]